jgi:uncharacterized protein YacL
MVERTVNKRMVRFGVWMAVYTVVMLVDGYWLPRPVKTDFVHVVGALVPMIPLLFAMQANIGAVESMDELGRRVCVEGMMFAIIGTIVVTLTVGFLQWMAAVPTISLGWVWPIIAVFYGIGAAFARRKYS